MSANKMTKCTTNWDTKLFLIAGVFMLVNTVCLWLRHFSGYQMSLLWAAVPAIIGLAASVLGILKLYPRVSIQAPLYARGGAYFAYGSSASLLIAAIWIFISSVFGEGISDSRSFGFSLLIGSFMICMVLSFIFNAAAFLVNRVTRSIGLLLLIPVTCWGAMLAVIITQGFNAGLSLDFYTNGVIGCAFLLIAFVTAKTGRAIIR
ncbi:hypothetical protein [Pseudoalteromonas sp. Of7M-16]|uniref:hypothetical protein n=1 Tax=Pseudoalteromonas sp. Of7M-16 TaxID=2917756 RepID=UPI001EF40756|nr:hypothetical protein [Pseudoalteromonas sp. Of7M-16]MCG7547838.1 hypothetical protein [Pseudoalteromonas sp. Of7M-16]